MILSLLTPEEEQDLDLANEACEATARGMAYMNFPIPDRQVPASEVRFTEALKKLDGQLSAGRNIVLHCRQGIGRTGLVAACLLLTKGVDPETAVRRLSIARGISVPETAEQCLWIYNYARTFVSANEQRPDGPPAS